jgi:uncharacterized Zn-binding protein involved in type VI secretion
MARAIGRIGVDEVGGTGILIGPPADPLVEINGAPVATAGQLVASHGPYQHAAATMLARPETNVFVGGRQVVAAGDFASCGDILVAGSNVFIG